MSFTIKRPVFAHSFLNIPSEQTSCDIEISIANSSGKITFDKEKIGPQTQLKLTIKDPNLIGLTDSHQKSDKSLSDLILAFNLNLERICLNIIQEGLHESQILLPPNSNVTVTQGPKGPIITVALGLSESVHITLGSKEEIDEQTALFYYEQVKKFDRFGFKSSSLKEVNVSKALNEYENAMKPTDRIKVFRSLFNCLEFCANSTGTKKEKDVLDFEISRISGVSQAIIESWRLLYNRTKHADTNEKQTAIYKQGIENLTKILPEIRLASKKLILNSL